MYSLWELSDDIARDHDIPADLDHNPPQNPQALSPEKQSELVRFLPGPRRVSTDLGADWERVLAARRTEVACPIEDLHHMGPELQPNQVLLAVGIY